MLKICKNCENWQRYNLSSMGECQMTTLTDGEHEHPESQALIDWKGDCPREAVLITREYFGCYQFSERQ